MEKTVEQKPILTQSKMEDLMVEMGQRLQALEVSMSNQANEIATIRKAIVHMAKLKVNISEMKDVHEMD